MTSCSCARFVAARWGPLLEGMSKEKTSPCSCVSPRVTIWPWVKARSSFQRAKMLRKFFLPDLLWILGTCKSNGVKRKQGLRRPHQAQLTYLAISTIDTRGTLLYHAFIQERIIVKYHYHVNGKIINQFDKLTRIKKKKLCLTPHKMLLRRWTHPDFCFAKTSFLLGSLGEIPI